MTKTIGAVVLSYNKAHIFRRFWDSLVTQTRVPDQTVIVDDGSTDGTNNILNTLGADLPYTLIRTNHVRQSAARNEGLKRLTTDLAIFIDGDLLLQMNMLARMEIELEDYPDVSFVYCPYDRTGSLKGRILSYPFSVEKLKCGNFISPMSLVHRKHLPSPCFDEELHRYEDWDLWVRMAMAGRRGRLIDETLFTAYYQKGDLSADGDDRDWFFRVKAKHGFLA